jgi:subfamily B ATP-binding cassette protein MsbA
VQQLNSFRSMWAVEWSSISELAQMLRRDNKSYMTDGTRPISHFTDSFVFEDVSFGYEPGQRVLQDIDTVIRRGETTAIVGGSGAGKTTLADLVARLHDPTEGRVLLDGHDLREYKTQALRRLISVVSQNTFLFHDTVANNITYGLADVSEERLRWAAEKANALEFIEELEHGFDTPLGDRGERLSGGQRQRISIARALLRNPEILILDEATSALDSVTEKLVQDSLAYLMEGRTVIVIAHRLSTVENADHVIVLEDGRIVEQGQYHDLLAQEGQLWTYHNLQYQAA